jgi:hypothetical protein
MNSPAPNWFPLGAMLFAAVLGVAAVWMLTVEFIRPTLPFCPEDVATAEAVATHRGAAGAAVWIGLVRGNLWTDYSMGNDCPQLLRQQRSCGDFTEGSTRRVG